MDDAERPSQDPKFCLIGSEKIRVRGAALPARMQTFEADLLTQEENLIGPPAVRRDLIAKAEGIDSRQRVLMDKESTGIPVLRRHQNREYKGHFDDARRQRLPSFNREGDCRAVKLRPGNVHSADDWETG